MSERFIAEDGRVFTVGPQVLAYRGKEGCTDIRCTQSFNAPEGCYGWHCARCDQPCSEQGHRNCPDKPEAAA